MDPVYPFPKDFFQALPCKSRESLAKGASLRLLEDGESVHSEGEMSTHLFVLRTGSVKFSKTDRNGRTVTLAIVSGEIFFGLAPLVCNSAHRFDAVSYGGCSVLLVPKRRLLAQISEDDALRDTLFLHLASRLMHTLDMLDEDRRGSVVQRLAHTLLRNLDADHSVALSQFELAQLLGVSRNAVGNALGLLAEENLIVRNRKKITVVDPLLLMSWLRLKATE